MLHNRVAFAATPVGRPSTLRRDVATACAQNGPARQFTLGKTVMPADTDYSGALWHGAYVRYLEEARVEYLSWLGVDYGALVRESRIELVVAQLALRYRQPGRLGDRVTVSVQLDEAGSRGVRLPLRSTMVRVPDGAVLAEADVVLAPVSVDDGKLLRRMPPLVRDALRGAGDRASNAVEDDADSVAQNGVARLGESSSVAGLGRNR